MGFINYLSYVLAFMKEIFAHLVDLTSGGITWAWSTPTYPATQGQMTLGGNIPDLTPKGEDIVGALMTIVHYGIIAAAQFVTLLPANGLSGYNPF